jgi:hypothetical protein
MEEELERQLVPVQLVKKKMELSVTLLAPADIMELVQFAGRAVLLDSLTLVLTVKPSSYGRGAGYVISDKNKCIKENPQGCEKYGLLYYPKCADGFSNAGCCVCSPKCPSGMTDIGVSCQKKSYGRGTGTPLICAAGLEEDAALCYTPCKSGFSGNGPVCWGSCPSGSYQCGALCLGSKDECTSQMLNIGLKAMTGVLEIASEAEDPVGAAISAYDYERYCW